MKPSRASVPVSVRPSSKEPVHTGITSPGPADQFQPIVDRMVTEFENAIFYGPPPMTKKPRAMKSRRIILTLECQTVYTLVEELGK